MVFSHSSRRIPGHHRLCASAFVAAAVLTGLVGTAFAQPAPRKSVPAATAPSNAPPVSSEPGATTATYGDWVLRCQRLAGESGPRLCEVALSVQVQGQTAPVAQVAIGGLPGQDGLRVTALLPGNISFPSSVRVVEGKDAKETGSAGQGLDLPWRRCLPGGCLADAAAPDTILKTWREASEGRLTFKDADGREVAIPLSFRGLSAAMDALAKEKS